MYYYNIIIALKHFKNILKNKYKFFILNTNKITEIEI